MLRLVFVEFIVSTGVGWPVIGYFVVLLMLEPKAHRIKHR